MPNKLILNKQSPYYLALILYVVAMNIQYSYAYNIWLKNQNSMLIVLSVVRYIAYSLFALHIVLIRKLNLFTAAVVFALLPIAVYATNTVDKNEPLLLLLILIASIQTDFDKSVRIFFIVHVLTFITLILLSLGGILGYEVVETAGRIRNFLGYGWVNRACHTWFFICLEYFYLNRGPISYKYGIVASLVNAYIYYMTDTVFGMIMTFGVIIIGVFNYHNRNTVKKAKDFKMVGRLSVFSFLLSILIGIALPITYKPSNNIMNKLNSITSGRLALGKKAIIRYGLHLGGSKLQWVGSSTLMFGLGKSSEYFYVDNSFLKLAVEYGLLFVSFIIAVYVISIWKASKRKEYTIIIVLTILGVIFIFEPYALDFAFNPFILYLFSGVAFNDNSSLKSRGNHGIG